MAPAPTLDGLAVLAMETLVLETVTSTLSVLFEKSESNWSRVTRAAVLVRVEPWVPASGVAVISRVAALPAATDPTVHTPVPESYVPWLGVEPVYVSPAGRESDTVMPEASSVPLFVAVTV